MLINIGINFRSQTAFTRLNIASAVSSLAGGLSWTGLPYLAVVATNNNSMFSILFIVQTLFSLVGNLYGGNLVDKIGAYKIVITSIIFIIMLQILAFIVYKNNNVVFVVSMLGIGSAIVGSFAGPALGSWIVSLLKEIGKSYEQQLATRNLYSIVAKTIGFSLGPIFYGFFQYYAFLAIAVIYSIEALLVYPLFKFNSLLVQNKNNNIFIFNKNYWVNLFSNKALNILFLITAINAAFLFPMISSVLQAIKSLTNNTAYISAFWLFASLGSVTSNLYVKTFVDKFKKSNQMYMAILVRIVVLILLYIFSFNPLYIIGIYIFYTLVSPVFGTIHFANIIKTMPSNINQGKIIGFDEFIENLSSLLFLCILLNVAHINIYWFALVFVAIIQLMFVKYFYFLTTTNK